MESAAIVLFVVALGLIASERVDRTKVALAGGALAVLLGVIHQHEAVEAVDWGVLGLLAGMMILVWGTEQTGVFDYVAVRVAQWSRGRPVRLVVGLTGATALASAFLDNVTTVLLMVPVTLAIADALEIPPTPLVIAEVVASNIGGAATLIGDPPNIIIAGASGLGFMDFIAGVGPPALLAFAAVTAATLLTYLRRLRPSPERVAELGSLDASAGLGSRRDVSIALGCLGVTLAAFFVHQFVGLEPPTIALAGAVLFLVAGRIDVERALHAVEWPTLLFFMGLFVLVGALEVTGVLEHLAGFLEDATAGSRTKEAMVVMWGSALASGVVDNIPFTAAMSPVVDRLSAPGDDAAWWALSIGACYGGNFTLVAASANLVAAGALRRADHRITFGQFLAVGVPMTLLSLAVATAWMLLVVL
ncbi:MAG: ArsB/NhaD family transporter [Thermoleophilia bacterium]|nr:ArsB/NhaD family transporter [Thermoleophilia bacterium]